VRNHQHETADTESAYRSERVQLCRRVEMRGGLVQQEEIRSALGAQKATRERDALTLSSGEVGTVLRDAPARVQAVAGSLRQRCCNLGTPPLEGPGSARCSRSTRPCCCGRRNSNVNLDDLRWDRPDIDCEPQQARGIPRNLQVDETGMTAIGVEQRHQARQRADGNSEQLGEVLRMNMAVVVD
jgi:hypothetical protein